MSEGKSKGKRLKAEGLCGRGVFRVGEFSLVRGKSGALWLWHEEAGGMVLDEAAVERDLLQFWKANF